MRPGVFGHIWAALLEACEGLGVCDWEIAALEVAWFGQLPPLAGLEALRGASQAAVEKHVATARPPMGQDP